MIQTARSDCFVSVVAPLRDDASIVAAFVEDTVEVLRRHYTNYELVLVDDGSTDDTAQVVARLLPTVECLRFIRLSRSFGEEIAITAGLDAVIGDFVVVMLPNSDPPELIPTLVQRVRAGSGIAFGVRTERTGESALMRAGARFWYWYARRFLRLNLPKNSSQFRALSRQAVNAIVQIRDRYRYLRILSGDVGYAPAGVPYAPMVRNPSRRERSFFERVAVSADIIVANSPHPLRFVTFLGVLASLLNVLYIGYVIAIYLLRHGRVAEGWTTLSLQNAGMFFFVFLILTVMSEYVGHILVEARDRPLYHVLEERDSPVRLANTERRNVVTESAVD